MIYSTMNDQNSTIREAIIKRVDRWLEREAPRVRDDDSMAKIEFAITNPSGDDNNQLVLNLVVKETAEEILGEDYCLTVPGLAFE